MIMNSINDESGCSVCQPGKENYSTYTTKLHGKRVRMYQYDYRTESGELFEMCIRDRTYAADEPAGRLFCDSVLCLTDVCLF